MRFPCCEGKCEKTKSILMRLYGQQSGATWRATLFRCKMMMMVKMIDGEDDDEDDDDDHE